MALVPGQSRWQTAAQIARLIGKASSRWPAARRGGGHPPGARPRLRRRSRTGGRAASERDPALATAQEMRGTAEHTWQSWGTGKVCSRCAVVDRGGRGRRKGCPGAAQAVLGAGQQAIVLGHEMWRARVTRGGAPDPFFLLYCRRCGSYGQVHLPPPLRKPCARAGRAGTVALQRLGRGLFPKEGARFAECRAEPLGRWFPERQGWALEGLGQESGWGFGKGGPAPRRP